jgi:hypothetical protein
MFATADWFSEFPNHLLKPLSSYCSDHCPLLLQLHAFTGAKRRFRFESFWVKLPGLSEVVAAAWAQILPQADPFRTLYYKLSTCSAALISTAYQPWYSVFLSQ